MREGARPLMELEDRRGTRNMLIWVAIGIIFMFGVGVTLFVVLATGDRQPEVEPTPTPATMMPAPGDR